jgi:hypothetical protein
MKLWGDTSVPYFMKEAEDEAELSPIVNVSTIGVQFISRPS